VTGAMIDTNDILLLIGGFVLVAHPLYAFLRDVVADLRGDRPEGPSPIPASPERRSLPHRNDDARGGADTSDQRVAVVPACHRASKVALRVHMPSDFIRFA
jgi:hypothetical protein